MSHDLTVRRALVSVSDKTDLARRASALAALHVEILSTGGTLAALRAAGAPAREVSEVTGFPEIMDGRVKTLHPRVHGGLLAKRDDPAHVAAMAQHAIPEIDLLAVNLYPFEATVASGADLAACIENIDIGGPAMIRAAAKNFAHVVVCVDAEAFDLALADMAATGGAVRYDTRAKLAQRAFARTAAYDAAIAGWMRAQGFAGHEDDAPPFATFGGARMAALRYGENPHQTAALYASGEARPGAAQAKLIQGKPLSYNNLFDADAAFETAASFPPDEGPAVAIIKHANPCGVALGDTLEAAYRAARACDPVSAFGGVIAANRAIDAALAEAVLEIFTEVVIAPDASAEALEAFARKANVRVLLTGGLPAADAGGWTARAIAGGLLAQTRDAAPKLGPADLKIVTKRAPTPSELADMAFAWEVAKHVKSNAIVFAKDGATAGVGAGQMSRLDSARIAALKAQDAAKANGWDAPKTIGSACASDAFFPFADGLEAIAEAGATAVIQPGGSMRDDEVIAAADARGLAMAFTGVRHFRH